MATAAFLTSCGHLSGRRNVSFKNYPFSLGVASGDPSEEGFVLWTRLAPDPMNFGGMPAEPVEVLWQVAEDEKMSRLIKKGNKTARPEWAHSVHVEVSGLKPDRWYFYRFKAGNELSPVGRARTLPAEKAVPGKLRFAFVSCQHYETGYFTAYEHMAREELDLVVHLGDYIYEGAGRKDQVRQHFGSEIISLDDYRHRYSQYRLDPALQKMHASAPWLVTWDDHEFDNNYASDISEQKNVSPDAFLLRRAAAYQAYYEHMPLRRSSMPHGPDMRLYRRVPVGRLAEFFVLDTRQYRSNQPCGDGRKPPCDEVYNPDATLLGRKQKEWLQRGLSKSDSIWNILAQQVMMARVDRAAGEAMEFSMDQWPGCEVERSGLIEFLHARKISNPVVLTGDIHTNWANELTLASDKEFKNPVAAEFVGTSLSSSGDGADKPASHAAVLAENPMVKFFNGERGYVTCEVTPKNWISRYRTMPFVSKPGAPIVTRATFALENGSARLQST